MPNKKPMNKFLLYIIFVAKFVSGLALIVWTVYMTFQSDVGKDDDNAFLSTYHNIDTNYNNIVIANNKLNTKYNIRFKFNDTIIDGISYKDIFLAQRAISKRKTRKNILKKGLNTFSVEVRDKNNNKIVKDFKVDMLVTMSTNHKYDKKLDFSKTNIIKFNLDNVGYWNITGSVQIANDKGLFFIKTDAK